MTTDNNNKQHSARFVTLSRWIATGAVIGIVLALVSIDKLSSYLTNFDLIYCFPLCALYLLFLFAGAINYYLIANTVTTLKFIEAAKVYIASLSVGMYTPAYLGEFGTAALMLKNRGTSMGEGLAVVATDKVISLAVAIFLFSCGIFLYFPEGRWITAILFVLSVIVGILYLIAISSSRSVKQSSEDLTPKLRTALVRSVLEFFLRHPKLVALNSLLTMFRSFVGAIMIWVAMHAVGVAADLVPVVFINFVARLITYIPITINGIGVLEGAAVVAFQRISIPEEAVISAFIIVRLIIAGFSLLFFIIALLLRNIRPQSSGTK